MKKRKRDSEKCPVCLTDSVLDGPKMFEDLSSCNHTVCKECLRSLASKRILKCVICRSDWATFLSVHYSKEWNSAKICIDCGKTEGLLDSDILFGECASCASLVCKECDKGNCFRQEIAETCNNFLCISCTKQQMLLQNQEVTTQCTICEDNLCLACTSESPMRTCFQCNVVVCEKCSEACEAECGEFICSSCSASCCCCGTYCSKDCQEMFQECCL